MRNWVRKPLFGREGDGVKSTRPTDVFIKPDDDFFANAPKAEFIYQGYIPAPRYEGIINPVSHPILGVWVVDGRTVGVGIPRIERRAHRLLVPLRPAPGGPEHSTGMGFRHPPTPAPQTSDSPES